MFALAFAEMRGLQVNVSRLGVELVIVEAPDPDTAELLAMFCTGDESIRAAIAFAPLERLNRHVSRVAWTRSLQ
jgi:hypothetical protein